LNGNDLLASFEYLEALYHRPILPPKTVGLRRIETLLELLGNPHRAFESVHVTGTCGKGSTATMIGSILTAAGMKAGIFRSPHLDTYRDRIGIGSGSVSEPDWLAAFEIVRLVAEDMEAGRVSGYDLGRVSLFEMVWAMAAYHYALTEVDFAVVEVGIGGRLSPTNVLLPEVSVVTNVSLDHTAVLGPTEVDIAREKARIIKPGNAATSAATQSDVIAVIRERAEETGSKLWLVGEEVRFDLHTHDLRGETFSVTTPLRRHDGLEVGMLGLHQVVNAATAVSALDLVSERGFAVSDEAVQRGLRAARLPGRFEVVSSDPLIVLDGARNVASATVLAQTVTDLFPDNPVTLLIGVLGDKDAEGIVDVLAPLARSAVVTEPPWEGRVGDLSRLETALRHHLAEVEFRPDAAEALAAGLAQTAGGGLLLVTGSLYLVAQIRQLLLGVSG